MSINFNGKDDIATVKTSQMNSEDQYIIDKYKSLTTHDKEIVDHICFFDYLIFYVCSIVEADLERQMVKAYLLASFILIKRNKRITGTYT